MGVSGNASPAAPAVTKNVFIPPSNQPTPKPLIFYDNSAKTWRSWKQAWQLYKTATGVHTQEGIVRVLTLISIIGEDGVNPCVEEDPYYTGSITEKNKSQKRMAMSKLQVLKPDPKKVHDPVGFNTAQHGRLGMA